MERTVKNKKDKNEYCVVCGLQTDVPADEPIQNRSTYYPGVGQMCGECCWKLYHTDDLRTVPGLLWEFEGDSSV